MDFGQPNVEIGRQMANGQLLFSSTVHTYVTARNKGLTLWNL